MLLSKPYQTPYSPDCPSLSHSQYPKKMAVTIACKHKCSCVRVIEITICFVLVTMRDLVDETRTQNSLFPGRKPNSFGNKDLYMYSTS